MATLKHKLISLREQFMGKIILIHDHGNLELNSFLSELPGACGPITSDGSPRLLFMFDTKGHGA